MIFRSDLPKWKLFYYVSLNFFQNFRAAASTREFKSFSKHSVNNVLRFLFEFRPNHCTTKTQRRNFLLAGEMWESVNLIWSNAPRNDTEIIAGHELLSLIRVPGQDFDEIGDERRNDALQNGTVSTDRVFLIDVGVVVLRHNYNFMYSSITCTVKASSGVVSLQSLQKSLFKIFSGLFQ